MTDEKEIDVTDVEAMDDLVEELTGSLMDAVNADNRVDPLSADYDPSYEEEN